MEKRMAWSPVWRTPAEHLPAVGPQQPPWRVVQSAEETRRSPRVLRSGRYNVGGLLRGRGRWGQLPEKA